MVTARERFVWKKLREKYGVIGEVAGRYVAAGYSVSKDVKVGDLVFDLVASKEGKKLAIKVFYETKTISGDEIEAYAKAAKKINAKPIIVLYGGGPRVSEGALEKIDEFDVGLRRIRP